ncbi:MAG: tetratricopeptide repeat protein [Thermoanaerobaculia bacterium]|nr:tetratricopeptide repeat protein [Thermoanaerobaculia bacterium]
MLGIEAAHAADPFYSSRLREGMAAADQGDHAEAARLLRIACFGLLEEDGLADCLIRLGLSQAKSGNSTGFEQSFRRLVEAEDLLGVYSRASLPPDLVAAYARQIEALIPAAVRQSAIDFGIVAATETAPVASGGEKEPSTRERRRELEKQGRLHPTDPRWPRDLAELERAEGRPKAALEAARAALERAPADPVASCVAGWGEAQFDRCRSALAYFDACSTPSTDDRLLAAECALESGKPATAREWLEGVPVADARRTKLDEQILAAESKAKQTAMAGVGPEVEPEVASETGAPPAGPSPEPSGRELEGETQSSPAATPVTVDAEDLATLRDELAVATKIDHVNGLYDRVQLLVADDPDNPDVQFLAGEIAYRASRWDEAVAHFDAGGDPGFDQPGLLFYKAIALYESGDSARAESTLRRCIDRLSPTPFVQRYREKILGEP